MKSLYELNNLGSNCYKVKFSSDKPAFRSNVRSTVRSDNGYNDYDDTYFSFVINRESELDEIKGMIDEAIAQVNETKRRVEETKRLIKDSTDDFLDDLTGNYSFWDEVEHTVPNGEFWDACVALADDIAKEKATNTPDTPATTDEKTPDASEKRKKPKRRHKKRDFVIKLKSRSCDGFPAVVYRFKVIGEVDTLFGVNFNAYIVMPLDNCLSYVYELTRTDCDMLGIRWQDGIALMSKNLDWIIPPDLKKQQREREQKKNDRISDWGFDPFGRMIL